MKKRTRRTSPSFAAMTAQAAKTPAPGATGADIPARPDLPPVMAAMAQGDAALALQLLAQGADATCRDARGRTPLHLLAAAPSPELLHELLARGCDASARTGTGETVLSAYLSHLERAADTALLGDLTALDTMDGGFVSADADYARSLARQRAAEEEALALLPEILSLSSQAPSSDVNARDAFGLTPLHHAAGLLGDGAVRLLLAAGAEVNALSGAGETPLGHTLLGVARRESAHDLLAAGADPNLHGKASAPLHAAAMQGLDAIVEDLLAHGADMEALTETGLTPIEVAADASRVATCRILLEHGAEASRPQDRLARFLGELFRALDAKGVAADDPMRTEAERLRSLAAERDVLPL